MDTRWGGAAAGGRSSVLSYRCAYPRRRQLIQVTVTAVSATGWWYRNDAMEWLSSRSSELGVQVTKAEEFFRRASYAAVVLEPGMIVCCLAGAARMSPPVFCTLNVLGTLARLAAIRGVGGFFSVELRMLLDCIENYKPWLLLLAMTAAAASSWKMAELITQQPQPAGARESWWHNGVAGSDKIVNEEAPACSQREEDCCARHQLTKSGSRELR